MKNNVVGRTLSVHNEHEFLLKLEKAGLNDKIAQKVVDSKKNELGLKVVDFIKNNGLISVNVVHPDYSKILSDWKKFYKEIFNLEADFSRISIPEDGGNEFPWLICVLYSKSLFNEQVFDGGKFQFKNWKYENRPLDEILNFSFGRDALKKSYIVRCKANYEADEDLKNLSANNIAEMKINTLTLKERLLLGRFIFWKENKLLDQKTVTLCSGSRDSDGNVPGANWFGSYSRFQVDWYDSDGASDGLRSRVAVSI